jgi:4-hydroxy-4-methyl-2-oxoglutarate aldolase
MYRLNPLPPQIDKSRLDLLAQAEPATIGHFHNIGFMDYGIRALFEVPRISGTAVTARYPGADGTMVHYIVSKARPGDILVLDRCGDHRHATAGGALAYAAREAGIAGIIVDGVVTDIDELRAYGVPVWARGLSTVTVKSLGIAGDFCVPVSCGGVAVCPGDAILADNNGVLVLSPDQIEECANRAIAMQVAEKDTLRRLREGEKYADILGSSAVIEANVYKG